MLPGSKTLPCSIKDMQWRLRALHRHCLLLCHVSPPPQTCQVILLWPRPHLGDFDSFLSLYHPAHPLGKLVCFFFNIDPESCTISTPATLAHLDYCISLHTGLPASALVLYFEQLEWCCYNYVTPGHSCSDPAGLPTLHGAQHSVLPVGRLPPASLEFPLAPLFPPSHLPSKDSLPRHLT